MSPPTTSGRLPVSAPTTCEPRVWQAKVTTAAGSELDVTLDSGFAITGTK